MLVVKILIIVDKLKYYIVYYYPAKHGVTDRALGNLLSVNCDVSTLVVNDAEGVETRCSASVNRGAAAGHPCNLGASILLAPSVIYGIL